MNNFCFCISNWKWFLHKVNLEKMIYPSQIFFEWVVFSFLYFTRDASFVSYRVGRIKLFCWENKSSTYVSQRNVHKKITDLILFIWVRNWYWIIVTISAVKLQTLILKNFAFCITMNYFQREGGLGKSWFKKDPWNWTMGVWNWRFGAAPCKCKGDDGLLLQGVPAISRVGVWPLAYLNGCTWEM